jgi:hypothetical protein
MRLAHFLLLSLTLAVPLAPVQAAERQPSHALPLSGQTMGKVLQQFGEPVQRHAPVGKPSITRWDYADWSVYFEAGRVVHSLQRQNLPPAFETVIIEQTTPEGTPVMVPPAPQPAKPAADPLSESSMLQSTPEMLHLDTAPAEPVP